MPPWVRRAWTGKIPTWHCQCHPGLSLGAGHDGHSTLLLVSCGPVVAILNNSLSSVERVLVAYGTMGLRISSVRRALLKKAQDLLLAKCMVPVGADTALQGTTLAGVHFTLLWKDRHSTYFTCTHGGGLASLVAMILHSKCFLWKGKPTCCLAARLHKHTADSAS